MALSSSSHGLAIAGQGHPGRPVRAGRCGAIKSGRAKQVIGTRVPAFFPSDGDQLVCHQLMEPVFDAGDTATKLTGQKLVGRPAVVFVMAVFAKKRVKQFRAGRDLFPKDKGRQKRPGQVLRSDGVHV